MAATIKSVTYDTGLPGPKLLILGAVHGNEKCGTAAIDRAISEIDKGELVLARGKATFVPITNPRAYDIDKRYVERNLNRYLVPVANPDCYEAELGNILCPVLEGCDALLDIHSYTVGGPPFAFVSDTGEKTLRFAAASGVATLMTGWAQAYAATGRKSSNEDDEEATGTIDYARRHGAMAVTVECGQHKDPAAADFAYRAIRGALHHLGLTDEDGALYTPRPDPRIVTVTHVFYCDNKGSLIQPWENLQPVAANQPIARDAHGLDIVAPHDGFIIMPRENCPIGEEWFYVGR